MYLHRKICHKISLNRKNNGLWGRAKLHQLGIFFNIDNKPSLGRNFQSLWSNQDYMAKKILLIKGGCPVGNTTKGIKPILHIENNKNSLN